MKLLLVLSVFTFCVSFSVQKVKYVNCPEDHDVSDSKIRDNCYEIRCSTNKYGSLRLKNDCPEVECLSGTPIGYKKPDNSRTFPDCCGEPICQQQFHYTSEIKISPPLD